MLFINPNRVIYSRASRKITCRVRLNALKKDDFIRILKETDNSLTKQYKSLFETENIELKFEDEALEEIATLTEQINTGLKILVHEDYKQCSKNS